MNKPWAGFCLFITSVGLSLLLITDAYAYFDQGTGSLLIQSGVAFLGIMIMYFRKLRFFCISFFWRFFMKFKKKPLLSESELEKKHTEL